MSVVKDILDEVETRMGNTTGVTDVQRPIRHKLGENAHKIINITYQDIEPDTDLNHVGNPPANAYVLPVVCAAVIMPDETDETTTIDELVSDFYAEMVKAITSNGSDNWHTFDDNAINAEIGPQLEYNPGDDAAHGCQFITRITYRVAESDPTTPRG